MSPPNTPPDTQNSMSRTGCPGWHRLRCFRTRAEARAPQGCRAPGSESLGRGPCRGHGPTRLGDGLAFSRRKWQSRSGAVEGAAPAGNRLSPAHHPSDRDPEPVSLSLGSVSLHHGDPAGGSVGVGCGVDSGVWELWGAVMGSIMLRVPHLSFPSPSLLCCPG